jgi:hypothetical protein
MKKTILTVLLLSFAGAQAATMTMTNALGGVSNGTNFVIGTAGFAQPANNWPNAESPNLAIDGLVGTKYLNFNQLNTGLIVTPDVGSASMALDGLAFYTANDSPGRDATTYLVYGSPTTLSNSTPGTNYAIAGLTLLSSGPLSLSNARDSGPQSPVSWSNETSFASYLIVFPTVKSGGYDPENNSMQIAEITFNGHAPVPEPTTGLLVGLLGAAGMMRRRRA